MTHIHPDAQQYEDAAPELESVNAPKPFRISGEWLRKFDHIEEPSGCAYCGAIAGACSSYPNCPNGPGQVRP